MSEVLEDIIARFPEFLSDEPVNGGDLVDFIGEMIHSYEAKRRGCVCGDCTYCELMAEGS